MIATYLKSAGALLVLGLATGMATDLVVGAALAQDLKSGALAPSLTPMGAERAASKDGTIPAWDGKPVNTPPGAGNKRPDPFAAEKPLVSITAANMAQHAERLTDGTRALLAKWPGMRIDVYPTHRSAVFSQAIYDAVAQNATRAKLANNGLTVEGAYGGIPFPVPKNGHEALWNHMLSYRGQLTTFTADKYVMTSGGDRVLTNRQRTSLAYPYYDPKGKPDAFTGEWARARLDVTEPPANAGQAMMTIDYVDNYTRPKDGWQYVPGQRRVRKSPSLVYDTPDPSAAGVANFDDVNLFIGAQDRYNVKLVGKREMYIPYNNNGLFRKGIDDVIGKGTLKPEAVRWELHRVWVLEATLREGKRNVAAKRRLYLDEDTWHAVMADYYDGRGKLWQHALINYYYAYDMQAWHAGSSFYYDLNSGGYVGYNLFQEAKLGPILNRGDLKPAMFTPEAARSAGN